MMASAAKRKAMIHLCDQHGVSQQRECGVVEVDRSSVLYRGTRLYEADLRKTVKAAERRHCRYRHIHIMLERQRIHMNRKKLWRLYREEGLQVGKRDDRKHVLGNRRPNEFAAKLTLPKQAV